MCENNLVYTTLDVCVELENPSERAVHVWLCGGWWIGTGCLSQDAVLIVLFQERPGWKQKELVCDGNADTGNAGLQSPCCL